MVEPRNVRWSPREDGSRLTYLDLIALIQNALFLFSVGHNCAVVIYFT